MDNFTPDTNDGFVPDAPTTPDRGLIGGASDFARLMGLGFAPEGIGAATSIPNITGNVLDRLTGKKSQQQASIDVAQNMNNNPFLRQGAGDQYTTNPLKYSSDVTRDVGDPVNAGASLYFGKGLLKNLITHPLDILHPIRAGGRLSKEMVAGQKVSSPIIQKAFGTATNPNPELYSILSSASGEKDLLNILKREISTLGQNEGLPAEELVQNIGPHAPPQSGVDLLRILNKRTGSYSQAYDKLVPKDQQALYRNIGRAYSNIIHQAVPGTELLDKVLSFGHKVQHLIPGLNTIAKYGGLGAAALGGGWLFKNMSGGESSNFNTP